VNINLNKIPTASAPSQQLFTGNTTAITISVAGTVFNWTVSTSNVTGGTPGSGSTIAQSLATTTSPSGTITYAIKPSSSLCTGTVVNVPVTVFARPTISTSNARLAPGTAVTLSAGTGFSTYSWKNSSNTVVGTSANFTTNIAGSYTVTVTKSGVTGSSSSSPFQVLSQFEGVDMNYILARTPLEANTDVNSLTSKPIEKVSQTIQYFDGLGRNIQTVTTQGAPSKKDMVQPVVYDAYGRETTKYLPYASAESNGLYKSNATTAQRAFYKDPASIIPNDTAFAMSIFERSPLLRPLKQGSVGSAWQPNASSYAIPTDASIKFAYELNAANEVPIWTYNPGIGDGYGIVAQPRFYAAGKLAKTKMKDEHNSEVITYTNLSGQVVLKKAQVNTSTYACTYYIYDDLNNLVCVVQPEGYRAMTAAPANYFSLTDAEKKKFLHKWAFQYRYDARNRLTVKKVPGAKAVYMVYDGRDRLVLTQDGNQRFDAVGVRKKEWTFTKYDRYNRAILNGLYVHTGNDTAQVEMQNHVNTKYGNANLYYEDFSYSNVYGYTNRCFPASIQTVYVTTYYDNYKFRKLISDSTNYRFNKNHIKGIALVDTLSVNGLLTGTRVNVLGASTYLWNVQFYDAKFRTIQTVATNHKGGIDRSSTVYDFVKAVKTYATHINGTAKNIYRRFEYDHAGRLLRTWHRFNLEDSVLLAQNDYNELGQLAAKKQHSRNNGSTFAQSIDFRYNIKGWMQRINDPSTPDTKDLFNLTLNYNTPTTTGGAAQYNGNISEAIWSSAGYDRQSYGYYYDTLNRLKDARYYNLIKPVQNGRFTETIGGVNARGYDLNGNIVKLKRYGKKDATTFGLMDDLAYSYTGNILTRVDDAITKNTNEEGFKEDKKEANEYTYDVNGSMVKDLNKGISGISYNFMNLTRRVVKSGADSVVYTYDATGRKLAQRVYGTNAKTTDYLGEFIYENNVLQLILHEEGRIVADNSPGAPRPWEYQYFLKDHLGNVRVTFSEKTTTTTYGADFESATNTTVMNYGSRSGFPLFNHTTTPVTSTYSQLLNGGNNSQIGAAKSLVVNPGDVLDLEVYAKYEAPGSTGNSVNTIANALISAFNITSAGSTPLDGQQAMNAFNANYGAGPMVGRTTSYEDGTAPRAYLNYILFDENFVLVDFGFDQISVSAKQVGALPIVPHDLLSLHVRVKQKGYLYVYLSNEQTVQTNVYFDDLKIVHTTGVEQENSYYAFGLTFNSYGRENSVRNLFQYNGKELQDELNLGWYDYEARQYDPAIGRWMAVDPLSEVSRRWSPYIYCYNNPLIFVDPDGMLGEYYNENGQYLGSDGIDDNKIYQTTDAAYNEHVDQPSFATSSGNGPDYTALQNDENTHYLGETNEFGLIQLTGMGNEHIANYGNEDSYSYTDKEGNTVAKGKHGDDWVTPSVGAAFNAAVNEFVAQDGNENIIVNVNDASAFNPAKDLGHSTHFTGESIDGPFIKADGSHTNDISSLTKADKTKTGDFVKIVKDKGFTKNYSDKGVIPNTIHSKGHADHFHVGK
jgi:RHS repeat-associated protein